MSSKFVKFFLKALCDKYGKEKITQIMKEIIKQLEAQGVDPKTVISTVAYYSGDYDENTGKVKDKIACIDVKDLIENFEEIKAEPNGEILTYREKIVMPMLFEVFGDDRINTLVEYANKITMSEFEYVLLITGIEKRRKKHAPQVKDIVVIENGELVLIIKYTSPEIAKKVVEVGKPGPISYGYATFKALANGYKGVKFKKMELLNDNEVAMVFEYI